MNLVLNDNEVLNGDDIIFLKKVYGEYIKKYLKSTNLILTFFPDSEAYADRVEYAADSEKMIQLGEMSFKFYQDYSLDEKHRIRDFNICYIDDLVFIKIVTPFTRSKAYDFIVIAEENHNEVIDKLLFKRDNKSKVFSKKLIGLPIQEIESKTIDFLLDENLRKFCTERDIPLKRSVIFEGAPGVGKSSVLKYIKDKANQNNINFDIFTDVKSFMESVGDFYKEEKKIFVFEDFDSVLTDRDSGDGTPNQILGKILNTLDGIIEIDNTVTIFTTNKLKIFDSAFVRPGRIDTVFTFSLPTDENIKEFLDFFLFDFDKEFVFNELSMIKSSINISYAFLKGIADDMNIFYFFNNRKPDEKEIRNIIKERSSQSGKGTAYKSENYIL